MEGEVIFDWSAIMSAVTDNILIPVLVVIGSTILLVVKSYAKKMTNSLVSRNEAEALSKIFEVKTHMVSELSTIVEAAVASNMQIANKLKENGHKLDDEEIKKLNDSARHMVMMALPTQMTDEDGSLVGVMGGREALDALIDSLMEKYVYEYKLKQMDPSFVPQTTIRDIPAEKKAEKAAAKASKTVITTGNLCGKCK